MAAKAVGLLTRGNGRALLDGAGRTGDACALDPLVCVLASLLCYRINREEALARAVSLGLARLPMPGESAQLTVQAGSRLFLAGYNLPAQLETGSLRALCHRLQEGRLVFAFLKETVGDAGTEVFQVCSLSQEGYGEPWLQLREPGPQTRAARYLPLEAFVPSWSAAHNLMIVAARNWTDLPTEGPTFFAGSRGRDGTFHWNTAECDTDASGRIVRF